MGETRKVLRGEERGEVWPHCGRIASRSGAAERDGLTSDAQRRLDQARCYKIIPQMDSIIPNS
jgi:hypothetical protein